MGGSPLILSSAAVSLLEILAGVASSISPADVCRDESSEAVVGFVASSGGQGVDGEPGHLSIEHVRVRQSTGKYRRPLIIGSATGRKKEMLMYSRENNESLGHRRDMASLI